MSTVKSEKFGSQLQWKSETRLFTFLKCMFPESNETKVWSHSLHLQNQGILQTRKDQKGDQLKINFDIFQIQRYQTEKQ